MYFFFYSRSNILNGSYYHSFAKLGNKLSARKNAFMIRCWVLVIRFLTETFYYNRDNFNVTPAPNTDGIVKCLLQPGQLCNQLYTSLLDTSIRLLKLGYPDSSCTRDKVSRAAGRRAVGSVFCSPFIKCTVTSKWRFHYRDSYVIGFTVTRQLSSTYRDWQKTRQP